MEDIREDAKDGSAAGWWNAVKTQAQGGDPELVVSARAPKEIGNPARTDPPDAPGTPDPPDADIMEGSGDTMRRRY